MNFMLWNLINSRSSSRTKKAKCWEPVPDEKFHKVINLVNNGIKILNSLNLEITINR